MGNKTNWLIHKGINLLKFKANVSIFNLLSNNDDMVCICDKLYLSEHCFILKGILSLSPKNKLISYFCPTL